MLPDECEAARFYANSKVHKPHIPGTPPPVRPIISESGATTVGIGQSVDYLISRGQYIIKNRYVHYISAYSYVIG